MAGHGTRACPPWESGSRRHARPSRRPAARLCRRPRRSSILSVRRGFEYSHGLPLTARTATFDTLALSPTDHEDPHPPGAGSFSVRGSEDFTVTATMTWAESALQSRDRGGDRAYRSGLRCLHRSMKGLERCEVVTEGAGGADRGSAAHYVDLLPVDRGEVDRRLAGHLQKDRTFVLGGSCRLVARSPEPSRPGRRDTPAHHRPPVRSRGWPVPHGRAGPSHRSEHPRRQRRSGQLGRRVVGATRRRARRVLRISGPRGGRIMLLLQCLRGVTECRQSWHAVGKVTSGVDAPVRARRTCRCAGRTSATASGVARGRGPCPVRGGSREPDNWRDIGLP